MAMILDEDLAGLVRSLLSGGKVVITQYIGHGMYQPMDVESVQEEDGTIVVYVH